MVLGSHSCTCSRDWWKVQQRFTWRKECKKYDLTAAQCFWLAHHNDSSRWFAISSPSPICCPSFGFTGGIAKEYRTLLGCEKYFSRSHTKHHWRCFKSPILGLYLGHNAHQGENSTFQTPPHLLTIIGGGKVPVDNGSPNTLKIFWRCLPYSGKAYRCRHEKTWRNRRVATGSGRFRRQIFRVI
jgi:hypothetical protein